MRLTANKLFAEIFTLMTYCAIANLDYLSSNECANRFENILEAIKQYKHIEDKLGIDLITYFKLNNDGFYGFCKDDDHSKKYIHWFSPRNFCAFDDEIVVYYDGTDEVYKTFQYKDYGKKTINGWALTEEELL